MTSLNCFEENKINLWSANFLPSFNSKPFANHEINRGPYGPPGFKEPSKARPE